MTTIVLNTATGAVSEYGWTFDALSPDRAGDAGQLYALGGDTDNGAPITGELLGASPVAEKPQSLDNVYLAVHGTGDGVLVVQGRDEAWEYPVAARASGVARAKPGRGIKEVYLGFGYRNVAGADFRLDRIDAEISPTKSRRN
jgi:hypothetical protein